MIGTGSLTVRVYDEDHQILCVVEGAELKTLPGATAALSIESRHPHATDVEHDRAHLALLSVRLPSSATFDGSGAILFTGLLTQARLYPGEEVPEAETCESCPQPHPLTDYLPPPAQDVKTPQIVRVVCRPQP